MKFLALTYHLRKLASYLIYADDYRRYLDNLRTYWTTSQQKTKTDPNKSATDYFIRMAQPSLGRIWPMMKPMDAKKLIDEVSKMTNGQVNIEKGKFTEVRKKTPSIL